MSLLSDESENDFDLDLPEDNELPDGLNFFDEKKKNEEFFLSDEDDTTPIDLLTDDDDVSLDGLLSGDDEQADLLQEDGMVTAETEPEVFLEKSTDMDEINLPVGEAKIVEEDVFQPEDNKLEATLNEDVEETTSAQSLFNAQIDTEKTQVGLALRLYKKSGLVTASSPKVIIEAESGKELDEWHMLIWEQNMLPLKDKKGEIPLSLGANEVCFATIVQNGEKKQELLNPSSFSWQEHVSDWQPVEAAFICNNAAAGGVVLDKMTHFKLNADGFHFDKPQRVILTCSGGVCAFLNDVSEVSVQIVSVDEEPEKTAARNYLQWFSGSLDDIYFEYSTVSPEEEFNGSDEVKAIYVNVGSSVYGWNVQFDNGVFMNLADVQEYQRRKGCLPHDSGVLSYGRKKLVFHHIERLVAGRGRVRYFSYL